MATNRRKRKQKTAASYADFVFSWKTKCKNYLFYKWQEASGFLMKNITYTKLKTWHYPFALFRHLIYYSVWVCPWWNVDWNKLSKKFKSSEAKF